MAIAIVCRYGNIQTVAVTKSLNETGDENDGNENTRHEHLART